MNSTTRPAPPPTASEADALLGEDVRVGGSDAARAVNLALLALSRTARSFQLYDASNESVRQFLEDLKTKTAAALAATGPLELEVRPFELVWNGDVVYLERDRER